MTVLDVSALALHRARQRLGSASEHVRWIAADITDPELALDAVDIWHDRAVFHFLTEAEDRRHYRAGLRSTLKPGGSLVLATFALGGPEKCSGLPVVRYSPVSLGQELGNEFRLVGSFVEEHVTPAGATQLFQWCRFVLQPRP